MSPRLLAFVARSIPAVPALGLALVVALATVIAASPARASGADSLMLHGHATTNDFDAYEIGTPPGEDEPDPLVGKNLRLDGSTAFVGGGLRGTTQDGGFRFGIGLGLAGATGGVKLLHEPLPHGVAAKLDSIFGANLEIALGAGFDANPIFPYLELRTSVMLFEAEVELESAELGSLGSTSYAVFSFGLGPRLGVFVPLTREIFIDFSGSYGLFGAERAAVHAGIGIWDGTLGE